MLQSSIISLKINSTLESDSDLPETVSEISKEYIYKFTDGSGANEADEVFSDTRTLGASASEDIDLNGVLTNALCETVNFVTIKAFIVHAAKENTNNISVVAKAVNGWVAPFVAAEDGVTLRPDGTMVIINPDAVGMVVAPGTADLLTITNLDTGSPVDYDIILIGVKS